MITGEGVLNFMAAGRGSLPVAGPYLTALQALPLAGRRCEGKLLVAHADDPELTLELARIYVTDNRRLMQLVKLGALPAKDGPDAALEREQASWDAAKKRPKYPDAKAGTSLIISDLIEIWRIRNAAADERSSVSVYWLSSSGQGPSLEIYHLPSNLLGFIRKAGTADTRATWISLVGGGWQQVETKPAKQSSEEKRSGRGKKASGHVLLGGAGRSRNAVLADLFAVYARGFVDIGAAHAFLRRRLLGNIETRIRDGSVCDWNLTELFLKEVLGMQQERITAIKQFADQLAEHIRSRNDGAFFRDLVYLRRASEFRNALAKAQRNEARANGALLFGLDEYLSVFEADDAIGRLDWSLVRDLISIRVVEQLQKNGWLTKETLGEEESDKTAA
jgi:CRISPR-associated protein Cst1